MKKLFPKEIFIFFLHLINKRQKRNTEDQSCFEFASFSKVHEARCIKLVMFFTYVVNNASMLGNNQMGSIK